MCVDATEAMLSVADVEEELAAPAVGVVVPDFEAMVAFFQLGQCDELRGVGGKFDGFGGRGALVCEVQRRGVGVGFDRDVTQNGGVRCE